FPGYDNFTQSVSDGTWKHPVSTFTHYGADGSSRVAKYPSEILDTQFYSSPEAIQKASGGYLDGRFEENAEENQADNEASQQTIDKVETTASAIPIVGAALGVGNAIGKPIKNAAEKTNEDGSLKSKNNATAGYIAGSVFNPASSV